MRLKTIAIVSKRGSLTIPFDRSSSDIVNMREAQKYLKFYGKTDMIIRATLRVK